MRFRWLLIGLLAALAGALVAKWWSDGAADEGVHGMSETPCTEEGLPVSGGPRADWGQLCVYRAANQQLIENKVYPEVVMIGDSITQGWSLPGEGYANRGIGGQMSGQILLRFRQDAILLKPKVIHILAGINDVTGIYGPQSPDMLLNNIRSMVELAQSHDIPVILGTIGPAQDVKERPQVDRARWVPQINDWLSRYAKQEGLVIADYHAVLAKPDGSMRKELFADTVHPNAAGYAAMDKVLNEALAKLDGDTGPE